MTMKNILFLICAVSLFVAGIASAAHADVPNIDSAHHQVDTDSLDHEDLHDNTDDYDQDDECQDCCCIHSHSLTGILTNTSNDYSYKEHVRMDSNDPVWSHDLSPLYRPPIA